MGNQTIAKIIDADDHSKNPEKNQTTGTGKIEKGKEHQKPDKINIDPRFLKPNTTTNLSIKPNNEELRVKYDVMNKDHLEIFLKNYYNNVLKHLLNIGRFLVEHKDDNSIPETFYSEFVKKVSLFINFSFK